MQEIHISIIIVNYNVKDFLLNCLTSIANSRHNLKVETLVVDNHSTDHSVKQLKPLFEWAKFIELDKNYGFAKANNIGIKQARGKYILILNPDTLLFEDTLQVMYNYMESNKEVGIAGCKVLNPDGSFQLACRRGFPTPWASFCKLFGLQSLFPRWKLFAQYNQTYRDINQTYYIDAVIGAFMFCRREIFEKVGLFDEDYFMYGEDLDLCYRTKLAGYQVAYVHTTSIIHYKGESTKRSSINELKHFYEAMEIFAKKHFNKSHLILQFIKFGIFLRSLIARIIKYRKEIFLVLTDILIINLTFILGTRIRFGGFFNLPDYAYPLVFIVLTLVLIISMISTGAYFENKYIIRRSVTAFMITFFVLSSLTYFFKEYAFSRGVLLMTIGLSIILTTIIRLIIILKSKLTGDTAERRIIFVGTDANKNNSIIEKMIQSGTLNINIVGWVTVNDDYNEQSKYPILGNIDYLKKIIEIYQANEIIITDRTINYRDLINWMVEGNYRNVRFHLVNEFEELQISDMINEITGNLASSPEYNILKFRIRFYKRFLDIIISVFLLSLGLPFLFLLKQKDENLIKKIWNVLLGKLTLIGIYQKEGEEETGIKRGITGLVQLIGAEKLSQTQIEKLNNYYLQYVNISLDFDILLKYLFRKKHWERN